MASGPAWALTTRRKPPLPEHSTPTPPASSPCSSSHAQRHDRFVARVCDLLGQQGPGASGGNKAAFLCRNSRSLSSLPADLRARHLSLLHKDRWARWRIFALGVSTDVCGRWPAHEFPGDAQAGIAALRSGSYRRSRHRRITWRWWWALQNSSIGRRDRNSQAAEPSRCVFHSLSR